MAFSFNPLRTIRAQICLGFVAMGVLTGALGGYGIYAASRANRIVVDIYDRPLMAINFARSASATFGQMENHLQAQLAGHEPSMPVSLDHLADSFFGDLAVAKQRSMSSGAARTAVEIQGLVQEWLAAALAATPDGDPPDLNMLSARILKAFDHLIELTAEDGFRERQRSLAELRATMLVSTGCTTLALLAAGLITFVLARRILRPLSAAATVADRIAQGELAVEIPAGRLDEIGRLLRSMHSMQASIRTMMDEEAEQRRSAQRRLVDAIEGAHEGVMLVGADGRIVIANSQARRFLPLAGDALQPGTSFDAIMARALPSGMASTADGAASDPGALLSTEGEARLGDRLWLKISRGLTRDGGFFLFWSDISDIKERELRLREAKSEAEAASRSKSVFLANMSHELRTPLNAIIGFSEIMAGQLYGALGDPRYDEYAGLITRSGRHLLDIISSILDFAKCEAGQTVLHREPVDLREIGKSCVSMVGRECASSGIALSLDLPAGPAIVEGDPPKLRQMLLNLLSNAMKFTPEGGAVRVAVTAGDAAQATLSVSDTGIGMKPGDIPVALAPFGQIDCGLSRSYEGTGLGLPLTKAFAELHDAAFEITSEPGQGTTVTLRFAAAAARSAIAALVPARSAVDELVEAEIA
ncbi:MAG TPA: ATP-binding protein [Stellaceae bacterium]|nr:ATP-binding protein [Stellaceae bacterium]